VDGDDFTRDSAAWALWQIPDRRVVPLLINALNDPYKYARGSAAGALGRIQDHRAVKPLSKLLDDKTSVGSMYGNTIAEIAAWALEKIGSEDAKMILAEWTSKN
jgi:HEAT repeat protein